MSKSFAAKNFVASSGNKIAFRTGGVAETVSMAADVSFSEK
jgi:hypothetical protein